MTNKYINCCGSCTRMDIEKNHGYKYYCEKRDAFYEASDPNICYAYDFDLERDYDELERRENLNSCYITTILCQILKFDDNCEILNIMRTFRNNVLQKDNRYLNILLEYDTIGPKIAENLIKDEDAHWIAKELLIHYIKPIIEYISINHIDNAVIMYTRMINLLKENYGINNDLQVLKYDFQKGGHGKVYQLKVNN